MPSFATVDPTARILLDASAIGLVIPEVSIRLRSALHRSGTNVDRGSLVGVVCCVAAAGLGAVRASTGVTAATIPGRWVPFLIGLLMVWLGIALRQWAVWTLGRFFTVAVRVTHGQTVVDRGPYRWVRHPSYTGLLLTLAGVGLALGNWLSVLALTVLPLIGLVMRIRVEEQALRDALGQPYRAYAAQHKRLVPGIW